MKQDSDLSTTGRGSDAKPSNRRVNRAKGLQPCRAERRGEFAAADGEERHAFNCINLVITVYSDAHFRLLIEVETKEADVARGVGNRAEFKAGVDPGH